MTYWKAKAGGGDVTISVWFEDSGVLVLDRQAAGDAEFTPNVARNSADNQTLTYAEPDPAAKKQIPFRVNATAAAYADGSQTLWHVAKQGGAVLTPLDDADLNPIPIPAGQTGLPLAPDCRVNERELRYFVVMFR